MVVVVRRAVVSQLAAGLLVAPLGRESGLPSWMVEPSLSDPDCSPLCCDTEQGLELEFELLFELVTTVGASMLAVVVFVLLRRRDPGPCSGWLLESIALRLGVRVVASALLRPSLSEGATMWMRCWALYWTREFNSRTLASLCKKMHHTGISGATQAFSDISKALVRLHNH